MVPGAVQVEHAESADRSTIVTKCAGGMLECEPNPAWHLSPSTDDSHRQNSSRFIVAMLRFMTVSKPFRMRRIAVFGSCAGCTSSRKRTASSSEPSQRGELVPELMPRFGCSERNALRIVSMSASTYRYDSMKRDESVLKLQIKDITNTRVHYEPESAASSSTQQAGQTHRQRPGREVHWTLAPGVPQCPLVPVAG